jgi:hypothetical protein
MTNEYNGWTNFETWQVALNISNEEYLEDEIRKVIKRYDYKTDYEIADIVKNFIEELIYIEEYNIYKICDTWDVNSWSEVDWIDIVNTYLEVE